MYEKASSNSPEKENLQKREPHLQILLHRNTPAWKGGASLSIQSIKRSPPPSWRNLRPRKDSHRGKNLSNPEKLSSKKTPPPPPLPPPQKDSPGKKKLQSKEEGTSFCLLRPPRRKRGRTGIIPGGERRVNPFNVSRRKRGGPEKRLLTGKKKRGRVEKRKKKKREAKLNLRKGVRKGDQNP